MKRKLCFLLAVAVLLGLVTLAGTEEGAQPSQPKIFEPRIIINLAERTMEIAFRYEEVAGNIDDAQMMIVIGSISASGEISLSPIPMKVAESRGKKGDEITPNVITQGRVSYYAVIPDTLDIGDLAEVIGAGIAVIDCRGRKAPPIFIWKNSEEKKGPEIIKI